MSIKNKFMKMGNEYKIKKGKDIDIKLIKAKVFITFNFWETNQIIS